MIMTFNIFQQLKKIISWLFKARPSGADQSSGASKEERNTIAQRFDSKKYTPQWDPRHSTALSFSSNRINTTIQEQKKYTYEKMANKHSIMAPPKIN